MLSATDIKVSFRRRDGTSFFALDGVSVEVPDGAAVGIVGESGSGKSTLARVICGLQKPDSGRVVFDGEAITHLSVRQRMQLGSSSMMQMIFQDASGALNPRQTVGDSVAEALRVHWRRGILPSENLDSLKSGSASFRPQNFQTQIENTVRDLFKKVGLPKELMPRYPVELSGGQCQRVCVARALALRPTLLIGDEPVSALDVSVQARILRLLSEIRNVSGARETKRPEARGQKPESSDNNNHSPMSLLLITHDLAVVSALCDFVYVLEKGKVVESGIPKDIFDNPTHPYTRRLLAAVPRI